MCAAIFRLYSFITLLKISGNLQYTFWTKTYETLVCFIMQGYNVIILGNITKWFITQSCGLHFQAINITRVTGNTLHL